jgi:5'-nucleotidase
MRGVSAIIGGDDHLKLDRPVSSRDGEMQIPIVQAGGEENHYLGRLDLEFAEINGVWVLREFYGRLLSVGGVAPDAAIVRIIEDYWAKVLVPVA